MSFLKTVFVMLGLFIPAYSLTVDFAPLQVGNVWVYEESFRNIGYSIGPDYSITQTIQITTTESRNDTTYFSASVRDSGIVSFDSGRIDVQYAIQGFKTRDSVITSNVNDSIAALEKWYKLYNIAHLFPFPVRDTASSLPDTAGYWKKYEQFYVWDNLIVDKYLYGVSSPAGTNMDSFILLQNVGLLESSSTRIGVSGGSEAGGTTIIRLISFNGKPAPDINLSSVTYFTQNKPRTGNQTAFRQLLWINQGSHNGPQNVRAVFDVRGRAVSASGVTNHHLNNGIYLYSN